MTDVLFPESIEEAQNLIKDLNKTSPRPTNLYHVKELLGHEDLQSLKHYTKLTITDLRKTHAKCHPREKEKEE